MPTTPLTSTCLRVNRRVSMTRCYNRARTNTMKDTGLSYAALSVDG